MRNIKEALSHRLVFKKLHKVIEFNQEAYITNHTLIWTRSQKKAKYDFKNIFSSFKYGKLITNETILVSEPRNHAKKIFLAIY